MIRVVLAVLLLIGICGQAHAHKLKVFAAVEGETVNGYAFFVGGGRPQGVPWTAADAQGDQVAAGMTDDQGRFSFDLPAAFASDITVTVDTREAHVASVTLPGARFARAGAAAVPNADAAPAGPAAPRQLQPDQQVAILVDAAVQRQIEPLLERIEQMDSRLRFVDILSGIFFIVGMAGTVLWARARRSS